MSILKRRMRSLLARVINIQLSHHVLHACNGYIMHQKHRKAIGLFSVFLHHKRYQQFLCDLEMMVLLMTHQCESWRIAR